jgi:hypothetical protein
MNPALANPVLWLGILVFVSGGLLFHFARREPTRGPTWLPRLGLAMGALGLATLAMTQQGLPWAISSICFSVIAIVYLASVLIELLKR